MELTFITNPVSGKRERIEVSDAHITFKNFAGAGSMYNREGDRNFALIIPTQEICDALLEDKNQFGNGWKVKIKPPKTNEDEPFMFLPVKVKFNGRGPRIWVESETNAFPPIELDEESVGRLDKMDIVKVDMDIRPYDDKMPNGTTFRTAYLQSMSVVQRSDRFADRYATRYDSDDMSDI